LKALKPFPQKSLLTRPL